MMPLYKDGLFGTNSIMFRMLVHKDPVYCTSLKDLTKYTKLLVVWGFFRGLSFRLPIRRARLIELIDRVHRFSMSRFGSEVQSLNLDLLHLLRLSTVDDINPALPIIRNIPQLP